MPNITIYFRNNKRTCSIHVKDMNNLKYLSIYDTLKVRWQMAWIYYQIGSRWKIILYAFGWVRSFISNCALTCLYRVIAFGKFYPNYQISCWTQHIVLVANRQKQFIVQRRVTFYRISKYPSRATTLRNA